MRTTHRTTALLLALALAAAGCGQGGGAAPDPEGPAHAAFEYEGGLEFVDPQHPAHPNWIDLGEIDVSEVRTGLVRLKNVERVPIAITNITAGCSCTLPSLSYVDERGQRVQGDIKSSTEVLKVPPGVTVELELRVDGSLSPVRNKDKLVIVRMITDFDGEPYVTVEARMRVVANFQCAPPEIDLGRIGVNAGGAGFTDIAPVGDGGARLPGAVECAPEVHATLAPGEIAGVGVWRLEARVDPPLPLGYQERVLAVATTGPAGEGTGRPFKIKLRWTGAPDVELVPTRLLLLSAAPGQPVRAEAELLAHLPGQRLKVLRSELRGDAAERLQVTLRPADPDADGRATRVLVALEPKGELGPGAFNGVLVLELDDPQYPRFEVPYLRNAPR